MNAVEVSRVRTKYNKPIYIGILELSKGKMYNFHYEFKKPIYLENINLCYMDTDYFIYDVKINDIHDIRNYIPTYFNISAYSKENA